MAALQSLFENYLQQGGNEDSEMEAQRDQVRAGVVVLLGALAKHLPKGSPGAATIDCATVGPDTNWDKLLAENPAISQ
jgi:hypothetical protein